MLQDCCRTACVTAACIDLLPLQVAKVLVLLHSELLQGCTDTLDRLRRQAPSGTSGSRQQKVTLYTTASVHIRLCMQHSGFECQSSGVCCSPCSTVG